MSELLKDVEKTAAGLTGEENAASTVERVTGGVARLAGGAVGDAVGGLLGGLMPYVLGMLGALILGLAAALLWDRCVIIPRCQARAAIEAGALASANAATAECNTSQDALRATVDGQNARIEGLQSAAAASSQAADAAASAVLREPLPSLTDESSASVNAELRKLRDRP